MTASLEDENQNTKRQMWARFTCPFFELHLGPTTDAEVSCLSQSFIVFL